jgi:hypothetical protein
MKVLKKIIGVTVALLAGVGLALLIFMGAYKTLTQLPSTIEIQEPTNVTTSLPLDEQRTLKTSRESAVRVLSLSDDGRVATSTGTYFKVRGHYYILTVMHGLVGECEVTRVWADGTGFTPCNKIVLGNPAVDYAIIEVDEIPSLRPVKLPQALPQATEWKQALSAQTKVYYTGFPNSTGPLTFDGRIVGYTEGDYIYMNSFAWGGASGSGVFTANGDFIGYILAIDIGQTEYGIDVLEDIVVVVPAFKIDWATLSQ